MIRFKISFLEISSELNRLTEMFYSVDSYWQAMVEANQGSQIEKFFLYKKRKTKKCREIELNYVDVKRFRYSFSTFF